MNVFRKDPSRYQTLLAVAGVFLLMSFFSPGRIVTTDAGQRLTVSRNLWTHGSFLLSENDPSAHGLLSIKGRGWTTQYGVGQVFAFVPFDMLSVFLGKMLGSWGSYGDHVAIMLLYVPLVGLLWWWLGVQSLRWLGTKPETSLGAVIVIFMSTALWPYASQSSQEEAMVGALFLLALMMALRWRRNRRSKDAFVAGLCTTAPILFRLNSVFGMLPIAGLYLDSVTRREVSRREGWRGLMAASLGALGPAVGYAVFSFWRFGSPFSTGYDVAATQGGGVFWAAFPNAKVALGLLAGPGKGLFVLSPVLIIGLFGILLLWKRQPFYCFALLLSVIASAIFHSKIILNPDGSECWAARYQVHLLGYWIYPTWIGIERCFRSGVFWKSVATILILAGISIQIMGSLMPDSIEYMQSDRQGLDRYQLIYGLKTGHLYRRASNLSKWIRGISLNDDVPEDTTFFIDQHKYVPNLWGPVYSKRLESPVGQGLCYVIWLLQGLAGVSLLAWSLTTGRQKAQTPAQQYRQAA